MTKLFYSASALLIGFTLVSCEKKEDPQLKEAAAIHTEAHEIMERIEPEVESLDSLETLLQNKKIPASDTAAFSSAVAALEKVKADFKSWEENLVTVPGVEEHEHEHEHKDGEHHHHEHKKAPDVAPDQHLAIQKEIKKNIEQIESDLKSAKSRAAALIQK